MWYTLKTFITNENQRDRNTTMGNNLSFGIRHPALAIDIIGQDFTFADPAGCSAAALVQGNKLLYFKVNI